MERQDTHMLKHDASVDGAILMYDVNMSGSFTWLLMRYSTFNSPPHQTNVVNVNSFFFLLEEYLSQKTSIITLVGTKAEDAWLPTRQISHRHAREIADQWDTGSFHINTRCRKDILLPLLYLARKIITVEEMVIKSPPA